mmetsp:Transcript_15611/g.21582  ORF Transcript_15611/g.21582 Transcript_15611/m.21582 type:complete len:371 (-) Transcript_15611:159-1271(-)
MFSLASLPCVHRTFSLVTNLSSKNVKTTAICRIQRISYLKKTINPRKNLNSKLPKFQYRSSVKPIKVCPSVLCTTQDDQSTSSARATIWSTATIIENVQVSADGTLRELYISVKDEVRFLQGVRFNGRQEQPRWLDSYQHPGSFVSIRNINSDDNDPGSLFCITSSPSTVHERSSSLDASLIDILVDSKGPDDFSVNLSKLAPGSQVEVSEILGRGFGSMFDEDIGLMSSMEDKKNLLIIALGTSGVAPARAVLDWIPVQAHSTDCYVTLVYQVENNRAAAYVAEWDAWRSAGVKVIPVYKDESEEGLPLINLLERGTSVFSVGDLEKCVVLVAGQKGMESAAICKMLVKRGVPAERLLFCDFFGGKPNQ